MSNATYTPAVRSALLSALRVPTHTLQRTRDGFVAGDDAEPVSRRCANWLERDGLFVFDNPGCPASITLTRDGLEAARQLQAASTARSART